jgi:hypothetical protein
MSWISRFVVLLVVNWGKSHRVRLALKGEERGGLGWAMVGWHAHGEKGQAAGRGKKRGGADGVGRPGDFGPGV